MIKEGRNSGTNTTTGSSGGGGASETQKVHTAKFLMQQN